MKMCKFSKFLFTVFLIQFLLKSKDKKPNYFTMDKPVSKHAKRRAAKKAQAQKEGGGVSEEKTREEQIKANEYAPGETKSNEEMESEE